jgi:hypothetical protein
MNEAISKIISVWKDKPRASAERLVEYYGEPDEITTSRLIWHNTFDGWKRTEQVNEEIPHNFPDEHVDFLDKFDDLARYDGSVIADRTKGELSARCGGTSMNFVAINLAHDIVTSKRSVDAARDEYARLYHAYNNGEKPAYTQKFQFDLPVSKTGDPDAEVA